MIEKTIDEEKITTKKSMKEKEVDEERNRRHGEGERRRKISRRRQ